jgi:hypothetical protein
LAFFSLAAGILKKLKQVGQLAKNIAGTASFLLSDRTVIKGACDFLATSLVFKFTLLLIIHIKTAIQT